MKHFVLLCLLIVSALAQQSHSKIERCGLGSKHECHCLTRTERIQTQAARFCNEGTAWRDYYKTKADCWRDKLKGLDHCSIAETWTDYDTNPRGTGPEGDTYYSAGSDMGPMCSMACKKHRCQC